MQYSTKVRIFEKIEQVILVQIWTQMLIRTCSLNKIFYNVHIFWHFLYEGCLVKIEKY